VDAGSDVAQAERFWNEGKLTLWQSQTPANEWPMREIMPPPRGIPTSLVARTKMLYAVEHGVDVTVGGRPIRIDSFEDWRFRAECSGLEKLAVMVCLLGIRLRSVGA
jgi:hypothetical protein